VAPAGTFYGSRATVLSPDAPLAGDDRTAMRVLYPDASDSLHIGSIAGRIVPANPAGLSGQPGSATGIVGGQAVAIDGETGSVIAAAVSGWSCTDPGPLAFDGSYRVERLPVISPQSYRLYAEPLDGPLRQNDAVRSNGLCRNAATDPGWPAQFSCTPPDSPPPFSTTFRTGP
jgi:hypothetical protein